MGFIYPMGQFISKWWIYQKYRD